MYEVTLEETWDLFAPYLDGARTGIVCVASAARLGDAARSALEKSAAALGYGCACCTYVVLRADGAAGDAALDGQALFLLLEGLDPLIVVAAGAEAARAHRAAESPEGTHHGARPRVGGDPLGLKSFEHMLDDAQSKQAAWALLKKLPRFGER